MTNLSLNNCKKNIRKNVRHVAVTIPSSDVPSRIINFILERGN